MKNWTQPKVSPLSKKIMSELEGRVITRHGQGRSYHRRDGYDYGTYMLTQQPKGVVFYVEEMYSALEQRRVKMLVVDFKYNKPFAIRSIRCLQQSLLKH